MRAIVSDIHGNLAALLAVLDDAAQRGADEVICLGDLVGYGPEPAECLDLAMSFAACLLGNFDAAVLYADPACLADAPRDDRERLVPRERTAAWTWQALQQTPAYSHPTLDVSGGSTDDRPPGALRRDFLAQLPRVLRLDGSLLIHASPRSVLHEYIYPEDGHNHAKMATIWPLVDSWCFVGHTHVAGILAEGQEFQAAAELPARYVPPAGKIIINPGSVGLPRDGDARASYLLWDHESIEFRRVPYDVRGTLERMMKSPDLVDAQVEQWLARISEDGRHLT